MSNSSLPVPIADPENLFALLARFAERLALWEAWEAISNAAQGVSRKRVFDPALG